ncbi:MAG: lipoprotein signal peptidase [Gammaproteobacteria bacterium]|nr:lipoprotein signal peptidase [Gammaproteobacteria bacterium]
MKKGTNCLHWLWLSAAVILLDQGSKALAVAFVPWQQSFAITPFFNLILAHNPGAAFSFLAWGSGWQGWLFGIIAVLVAGFLIHWLAKLPRTETRFAIALALIVGGALGNVIDRIIHGYVIDFLDFHVSVWHWPAFNVADSGITIGAALIILQFFLSRGRS